MEQRDDAKEQNFTSLETSPPSWTRQNEPDIIQSSVPSLIARSPGYPTAPISRPVGLSSSRDQRDIIAEDSSRDMLQFRFDIGARVYALVGHKRYGVIRYLGAHPNHPDRKIVGIEMENADSSLYTDGEFAGIKRFECPPKRAFFIYLDKCHPDDRGY